MRRKIYLLATLTLLLSQLLPIPNTFAAFPDDKKADMTLTVNDGKSAFIDGSGTLTFKAKITDKKVADLTTKKITWSHNFGQTTQTSLDANGVATLTLQYSDVTSAVSSQVYTMTATYDDDGEDLVEKVGFGVVRDLPAVTFSEPGVEDTVSINDPIHLKVQTYLGDSSSVNISWACSNSGKLSAGYTCPSASATEAELAYNSAGTYEITVTVKDETDASKASAAVLKIIVKEDLPIVKAETTSETNTFEVGSTVTAKVSAKDKFGTINKYSWGCGTESTILALTSSHTFSPSASTVNDYEIKIILPDTPTENFHCVFSATDDDNESGTYDLKFKVVEKKSTIIEEEKKDTTPPNTSGLMTKKSVDSANEDINTIISVAGIIIISLWSIYSYKTKKQQA